jgi:hypothetical protein
MAHPTQFYPLTYYYNAIWHWIILLLKSEALHRTPYGGKPKSETNQKF